jgi:predicted ATPase
VGVNKMVADVLHYFRDPEATMELSRLVFEKTKGNPFFTISFLTKLYQHTLVVRDTLRRASATKADRAF